MLQRRPLTRLSLALPPIDLRVYSRAAQMLARIMGPQAPDVGALIQLQLTGRDPTGVADDYLDSIRWPSAKGRVVTSGLPRRKQR
jgi:hypothetical protein